MLLVIRVIRVIGGVHGCTILGRSRSSTLRPSPGLVINGDQLRRFAPKKQHCGFLTISTVLERPMCRPKFASDGAGGVP